MWQRLPGNIFEWIKDTSHNLIKTLKKNYNEESDEGDFLKLMFNVLKNYMTFTMIYHFYPKK